MHALRHYASLLMVCLELSYEADIFIHRLADKLSTVAGWVQSRLYFAVLCATMLCVRGSQTRWRSLGILDGASIVI